MKRHIPGGRRGTQSSALIISLFFIVLITLLVVGFLGSSRIDILSSRSHVAGVESDFYAMEGPDAVLAALLEALTTNSGLNLTNAPYWVTQPGRVTIFPTNGGTAYAIDLSSGTTNSANTLAAVYLNIPSLVQPLQNSTNYLVDTAGGNAAVGSTMLLKWIYIRANGALDPTSPPVLPANDPNPVVGRFAFWTDDNGARINLNTAWARNSGNADNPTLGGSPYPQGTNLFGSFINLAAITNLAGIPSSAQVDPTAIQSYRETTNHFNSMQEAAAANNAAISYALTNQNFSFTHYNTSPNLNMFNEPRIMLTTQVANLPGGVRTAGVTNFIDILKSGLDNQDPGPLSNLDTNKVGSVVSLILSKFARTNWPGLPANQSIATKYQGAAGVELAMSIVDYVRSAESTNLVISPLRGSVTGTTFTDTPDDTLGNGGPYYGGGRRPYLSQVTSYYDTSTNVWTRVEVYLPLPLPWAATNEISYNLTNLYMYDFYSLPTDTAAYLTNITTSSGNTAGLLYGGTYGTVAHIDYQATTKPTSTNVYYHVAPVVDSGQYDAKYGSMGLNSVAGIPLLLYATNTSGRSFALRVQDPAVSAAGDSFGSGDWQGPMPFTPSTNIPNTGVVPNIISAGDTPPQDLSAPGGRHLIAWRVPAPKGQPSNPYGQVYSVGELGFIPTGMDLAGTTGAGIPWRTVHLQPSNSTQYLPDWAILDLFCVPGLHPNAKDQPFYQPATQNAIGGLLNVNGILPNFANTPTRRLPLTALFLGTSPDGTTQISASATSTYTSSLNGTNFAYSSYGGEPFTANNVFSGETVGQSNMLLAPGQIAELANISDQGEVSEAMVRELIGQITVRSNVFTVYSVGQALQEDKLGGVHVLGESRYQTMIERAEPAYGTSLPTTPTQYLPVFTQRMQ